MGCKKATLVKTSKKSSSGKSKSIGIGAKTPFGKAGAKITFGGKKK